MTKPEITLTAPAPQALVDALHDRLADTGQALRDDQFQPFILTVTDDTGTLTAGCKGEIAFPFHAAHVSELWVDAQHRGQGLGSRLLDQAEAHAKAHDCTRIHIECRNEGARKLYERQGFKIVGTLEAYDGATPFYYMEKQLV